MGMESGNAGEGAPYLLLLEDHIRDNVDSDDSRLRQLGYKQELSRRLSAISNFSVTFSIISILTGLTTLFNTGLEFGGPVTMIYGWPIAGGFSLVVGLAMAEICSAYPTSGGLYFWSARLCGEQWGPFASWITGCELRFFGWSQNHFHQTLCLVYVVVVVAGNRSDLVDDMMNKLESLQEMVSGILRACKGL